MLSLTERCNLRCVHCYINRPAGDKESRQRELGLGEWCAILDQLSYEGILWLLMTGGEPLLHPDFAAIYLYAKQRGFHVTIYTNGTLLTTELAALLEEYPPWQVEISLYGANAETYESITGVRGSFARCLEGIDLLCRRGIALGLKTMAMTLNVHEIESIQQIAEERGLRFRYDPMIFSRQDGSHQPLCCRMSVEEIVALERQDPKRLEQWQELCSDHWLRLPQNQDKLFPCGAGLKTFHIDAYGGFYPCVLVDWLRYDLRSGSLEEALRSFVPAVRALPITHDHTCGECSLRIPCQNCPGWAHRETGDAEAPEPFRCQLAHYRREHLGLEAQPVVQHQLSSEIV